MKFINELREGEKISGIYLCKHKQAAVTKNGKPYENLILQDKTGVIDTKIWELNNGIDNFEQIFRTYSPVVHRFLLSLCGDVDLAQELTAETFYQAYLHIGKDAPQVCPVCAHPQAYFQLQATNY